MNSAVLQRSFILHRNQASQQLTKGPSRFTALRHLESMQDQGVLKNRHAGLHPDRSEETGQGGGATQTGAPELLDVPHD